MSFLEPFLLALLPLAALPVIIHLINQRRFQTIDWGAMRFLLEANRMSRGFARIRQWIILALRVLAVAGLIFAISRPLARGWLGLAGGGRSDVTLILLDRSPSMSAQADGSAATKLETGVRQLAQTLATLGSSQWVLIDGATLTPQTLKSPEELLKSAHATAASSSTDLPALMQAAHDYLKANRAGQTEIWICSDLQAHDWNADSGQWKTLREAFLQFQQGVRFHLLAYAEPRRGNLSVRVTDARRSEGPEGPRLLLSLTVRRDAPDPPALPGDHPDAPQNNDQDTSAPSPGLKHALDKLKIPVRVELEGVGSEMIVELAGAEASLVDHPIPIEAGRKQGWGRVTIPADGCAADNEFYFAYAEPAAWRTVVVADEPAAVRALALAAAIGPDAATKHAVAPTPREQLSSVAWEETALLIWQGTLPEGDEATAIERFLDRSGAAWFLPPRASDDAKFLGVSWGDWTKADQAASQSEPSASEPPMSAGGVPVQSWRGDQDLLARTNSGAALPAGELAIRRYCRITGETTPLATLRGGATLLARAPTERGAAYFLATTGAPSDSNLAANGVVLYAAVQRALAAGAAPLGLARQVIAAQDADEGQPWQRIAGADGVLSTEYPHHAGVYEAAPRLLAVNRSAAEDRSETLAAERVEGLFAGLPFDRVDDRAGSGATLTREIWRLFLTAMIAALIAEAALCLPKRPTSDAAEKSLRANLAA